MTDVSASPRPEEPDALYRAVYAGVSEAILVIGEDRQIVDVNPAALALLGYGRDELVGAHAGMIVPEALTWTADEAAQFARVGRWEGEGHLRRKDGSVVEVNGSARMIRLPDGRGLAINVFRETSDRRAAAQAIAAGEARFRALIENSADIIAQIDLVGQMSYVSPSVTAMMGYRPEELVGQICFEYVHPDDIDHLQRGLDQIRHTPSMLAVLQYRARHRDGSWRWLEGTICNLLDDPSVQSIVVNARDVTERVQAEEALRRAEKLRTLGQLAGGVAHDLNQSLSLIAGYTELALSVLRGTTPDTAAALECLELVANAASDGAAGVRRLLTFSRVQPDGEPEPVDVAELLLQTARLTSPRWRDATQAEGRPVNLEVAVEDRLVLHGWPAGLREALTNLIFNAVDALPNGGTIRLDGRCRDGRVEISVSDDGTGMTPETRARLFEPFFTTKGERGTGLGLAMVFHVVERHAGAVRVDSQPGQGTTFVLSFEAHQALAAPVAAPRPGPTDAALRVLAVDDEPNLVRMVAIMLGQRGHQVTTATSAEEALAILHDRADAFDVLLTDLGLGEGQNGWALVEQASVRWPRLRCVLATGWGADIDPDKAQRRHVKAVVPKPYRVDDLQRAILG